MKKSFFASLAGTLLGGILLIASQALATLPLPGTPGPTLGDPVSNLYTLAQAYTMGRGYASLSTLSVSQTSGQANCTQLSQPPAYALVDVTTSSGTGYICLPTAIVGHFQAIWMNVSQTLDIYSSATSFTPGTADTINTTGGATPYTANTGKKLTLCYAVANGAWVCGTIS